jgi:ABC-2 type transport system permease protein
MWAWTLAIKDARLMWRDGRFRWTGVLLLLILVLSLLAGWSHTVSVARLHAEAQRLERQLSLDKGEMNPHAAAHYGAFVFKPIEPLSAVDPGVDPYVGVSVFLEAHRQQLARHRPADDATPLQRLGELSAAMSLQALVPLLIVLLTYPSFAGERDAGTLRQLAAHGLGRWTLAAGKTLGVWMPLAGVLAPAAIVGTALMAWYSSPPPDRDAWLRAATLVACYLVYFSTWVGLGLAVSARATSSGSALVTLLAIWFAAVLVMPRASSAIASWRDPAPTAAEFAMAIERARDRLPDWTTRVERVEERFLAGELPDLPGSPSNPEVIALIETETDQTALYDEQFDRLFDIYDRQTSTYERLSALAPSLAIQMISMSVAGTDYDHHRRFMDATDRYRQQFVQTLNAELSAYQEVDTFEYTRGRELWERIPDFDYAPPELGAVLAERRQSVASLFVWAAVVCIGAGWAVGTMRID